MSRPRHARPQISRTPAIDPLTPALGLHRAGAPGINALSTGALGEIDAAFDVFRRAEEQNQLWLYYTGLPGFDPVRTDPRFAALVQRLGLPTEGGR